MYVLVLLFMSVLAIVILLVTEIMRIHTIAAHVETEMSRAINIAVETAIDDTWRIDMGKDLGSETANVMDITVAKSDFNSYLYKSIGLTKTSSYPETYTLYSGGKPLYRIELAINATSVPPYFEASGTVYIRSLFTFIAKEAQVPFRIRSRNKRI